MGCSGCSSGRGCSTGTPAGCKSNGSCGTGGCNKLNIFDWLANMDVAGGSAPFDIVEVRFKNSRKEFFKNVNNLPLKVGDIIAVEANPGHDLGVVSIAGELVRMQLRKRSISLDTEFKKVYRHAKQADIDKWQEAQQLENPTMHRARTLASSLGLQMKISDVEYQGDKTKAIFYYTADDRVDFRELIKLMADEFKIRIEMRQIGARQEASRLGGIGSCGRELCCSTWLTDFRSVSTSAARYQQLSLNPLKLAGQCGKLKCCLNYELDSYLDAIKDFPDNAIKLETQKGRAFHQKTDIFRRTMWYSYTDAPEKFIALSIDRVHDILRQNQEGQKPEELELAASKTAVIRKDPDYENVVGQDSINRFDNQKKKSSKNKRKNKKRPEEGPASPAEAGATTSPQQTSQPENRNENRTPSARPDNRGPRPTSGSKPRPNPDSGNRPAGNQPRSPKPAGNRPQGQRRGPDNRGPRPQQNKPGNTPTPPTTGA